MKKIIKSIIITILIAAVLAVGALAAGLHYLTKNEYIPKDTESINVTGESSAKIMPGDTIKVMTYNIAYCAMGKDHSDYLDGGSDNSPANVEEITDHLTKITKLCTDRAANVNFFQQVDIHSDRSCLIDQHMLLSNGLSERTYAFAPDLSCVYVPMPIGKSTGQVVSGLMTVTQCSVDEAARIALPNELSSPASAWSRKPCMLTEHIKLGDSGKELVLINTNFEEYDDGSIRESSYKALCEYMQKEYAHGNYVIAAGGFNAQLPSVPHDKYEDSSDDNFTPLELSTEILTGGWKYCTDASAPTVRRLNSGSDTAEYSADGFITSPNTLVDNIETIDTDFRFSNHNPVICDVTLVYLDK